VIGSSQSLRSKLDFSEWFQKPLIVHISTTIRSTYAESDNKSQGQTLAHLGIDLCAGVLAHGQLHAALK
ncbi:unnamed protein product, partial [Discosporangium mesarthrocarpum]